MAIKLVIGLILATVVLSGYGVLKSDFTQNKSPSRSISSEGDIQSDYTKICKLPRNFISNEVYNQYCRNNQCLRAGESCSRDGMCCSQMCIRNVCAATGSHLLLPGEVCRADNECYSKNCSNVPSGDYKVCYGDNNTPYCSRVGGLCKEDANCCSNVCDDKHCIGSRLDPAPIGAPCKHDNSECETYFCNLKNRRCE